MSIQSIQLIVTKPNYTDPRDLLVIANNPEAKKKIEDIERSYYQINVAQAMENLSMVSGLLQMAYAGSKGLQCNTDVIKIMVDYQTLIKDSVIVSGTFVQACLQAIRWKKSAIQLYEKDKFASAMKIISKCSEMAGQMAEALGRVVIKADELCILAGEALMQARNDAGDNAVRQQQIKQLIEASSKHQFDEIENLVEKDFKKRWGLLPLHATISGILDKESLHTIPMLNAAKAVFSEQAQKERREANAELAETVSKLKKLSFASNEIDKVVASLEVTMKTLIKTNVVFKNVQAFLKVVKNHYLIFGHKASIAQFADKDFIEDFKDELIENTWNWLVLGKVYYTANQSLHQIDSDVDQNMFTLHNESGYSKIINQITTSIMAQIENENELLTSPGTSQSDDNDTNH